MTTELIVALDTADLPEAERLAKELKDHVAALKVGLTLFTAHGPEAILEIGQHAPVFCDLKLHDISHQVGLAAKELARQGVWMFTVHASGGAQMIREAVEKAAGVGGRSIVAAVTVLTSLSSDVLAEVGQGSDPQSQVLRLAELALDAGADAIVCSPHEVAALTERFGDNATLVVPGIRPSGSPAGDQARIMTPAEAASAGARYIVVGRPVTEAEDPVAAAQQISRELRV